MTDESIFAAALAIAGPAERTAFLDRACAGNAPLRSEVEALLAAHAADNLLDRPPADLARTGAYAPADDGPPPAAVGDRIGPYRLMEQIGEGGFGLVFVAEQTEPVRRKVALKVLKPGMDTRDVVARFEAERQALALMDHPNIAKVLDGGTTGENPKHETRNPKEDPARVSDFGFRASDFRTAGRPYFVMELVRGLPITDWCDQQKLSPRQRLELFATVCRAVQHAHQKGVIHRDLKPSNVLVTSHDGVPVPKVIDFGVAKAVGQSLTEKTIYTRFAQMIGTPLYMSPEQAEMSGLDVDTRTDVYALGVLLYELLTGTTPFDQARFRKAAFDEIRRIIREEEPPRPSTRLTSLGDTLTAVSASRGTDAGKLAGLVRGELDWIVMRALEKDRNRRYESAAGLAKDVERFLGGDAVEACPPTLAYRLRKAYRRNRAAVLVGGAFAAVLLAATGVSLAFGLAAKRAEGNAITARDAEAAQRLAAVEAEKEADRKRGETAAALGKLRDAQEKQEADQYVWDMQLLPLAFEAGNVTEVNRLLARHVPEPGKTDRRGFEWFYWHGQANAHVASAKLFDSLGTNSRVAVSADGSRLAAANASTPMLATPAPEVHVRLRVWDMAARKELLSHSIELKQPPGTSFSPLITGLEFSKDGKRVMVNTGVRQLGLNPDGGRPVSGESVCELLDVATGKVLLRVADRRTEQFGDGSGGEALSPDGRRLAVYYPGRGQGVRVWDVDTGKEVCEKLSADRLIFSPFTPDRNRLVAVVRGEMPNSRRAVVYDPTTGKEAGGWPLPDGGTQTLSLSPDGKLAAAAYREEVRIWEVETGRERHTVPVKVARPLPRRRELVFSPDGSRLAVLCSVTGSAEGVRFDVIVCNPGTGEVLPPPEGVSAVDPARANSRVTFSPDGKYLAVPAGNTVRVWDATTGKAVQTHRGHAAPLKAVAFAAGGERLWSVDDAGVLKEWNTRPPAPVRVQLPDRRVGFRPDDAFRVAADGSRLAALTTGEFRPEGRIVVQMIDGKGQPLKPLALPPGEADVRPFKGTDPVEVRRGADRGLGMSRDGRRVALACEWLQKEGPRPTALTVWDAETGGVLLHKKLDGRHAFAALSPDGQRVAVVVRGEKEGPFTLRVFDVADGRERAVHTVTDALSVPEGVFSPDGRRILLLVGARREEGDRSVPGRLLVVDADRGEIVAAAGHDEDMPFVAWVRSSHQIAWSPDGTRFAFTRNSDGLRQARRGTVGVTVYDAATARPVASMDLPTAPDGLPMTHVGLAFSPDGRRLAAVAAPTQYEGHVRVWDAATGKELLVLRPPMLPGRLGFSASLSWRELTFSPDGRRLLLAESRPPASAADRTRSAYLIAWDAPAGPKTP